MEKELLTLTPTRYLCPICGEWHEWKHPHNLEYYGCDNPAVFAEPFDYPTDCAEEEYTIFIDGGCLYFLTGKLCEHARLNLKGAISSKNIIEHDEQPIVTFYVPFTPRNAVGKYEKICNNCKFNSKCNLIKLSEKGNPNYMKIPLGFEFEQSEYMRLAKVWKDARKERECENALKERENALKSKEQSLQERESALEIRELEQQKIKEDESMATINKTSIKAQLYEKSPKENLEIVKAWTKKYKPTLQWVIPMVAVYGAYRILNSNEIDLSVNNIAKTCKKKLGFNMEFLEDKRALKELMVIGGLSAGAYGAVKAISGVFGDKEEKDISVEEVEAGMNQLESISKKFAWIQPKTENMLPVAFSVIFVYATLHEPKFTGKFANKVSNITGDFKIKLDTYIEMAKLFIQDKFNMDLSTEEDKKKLRICAFFVIVMGIFAFLYGKKILGNKASTEKGEEIKEEKINKSVQTFVDQAKVLIEKIAPTVYTTLITFLISKKILTHEEIIDSFEENQEYTVEEKAGDIEPPSKDSTEK